MNLQRTPLDDVSAVRVWARLDDAFGLLAKELGLVVEPVELKLPPGDVFPVPYDAQGRLDRDQDPHLRRQLNHRAKPHNARANGASSAGDAPLSVTRRCGP